MAVSTEPDSPEPGILYAPGPEAPRSVGEVVDLGPAEVHVWAVDLSAESSSRTEIRRALSADEVERAERFVSPIHRRRFRVARFALRSILARYTGIPPGELAFRYGPHGKPALREGSESVAFNLSHSGNLALVAVTRCGPLGVDVEGIRSSPDLSRLARRVLSPAEQERLGDLPEAQRPHGFFLAWTRKEALVKMLGEGVFSGLRRLEVTLCPGEPARVLGFDDPERGAQARRWRLYDLEPASGFAAALATVGRGAVDAPSHSETNEPWRIRTWRWRDPR